MSAIQTPLLCDFGPNRDQGGSTSTDFSPCHALSPLAGPHLPASDTRSADVQILAPNTTTKAHYQVAAVMPKPKGNKAGPAKAKTPSAGVAVPSAAPPAWPLFEQPSWQALEPESMLDGKVVLIRNFWTKSLCRDYVSFLRTLSLTTTPGKPRRGEAARVNDRFQVHDHAFASRLWAKTGLRDVLLGDEWKSSW